MLTAELLLSAPSYNILLPMRAALVTTGKVPGGRDQGIWFCLRVSRSLISNRRLKSKLQRQDAWTIWSPAACAYVGSVTAEAKTEEAKSAEEATGSGA